MKAHSFGRHIVFSFMGLIVIASMIAVHPAKADDNVTKTGQVNVPAISNSGSGPTGCTPTSFSFDISWVDPRIHAYFLADRTHGENARGDALMIDINNLAAGPVYITPPANDPFAGIRCDQNAAFGGTGGAGRNEITGPNGIFTVSNGNGVGHPQAWLGDAPSDFSYGQTNTAADYASDPCDSSVRVFDITTRTQIDHINVGGCFRTDEGAYDPKDQIALFANPSEQPVPSSHATALNNSPFITLISTKPGHKILRQINFDGANGTFNANGGIEQAVYSPDTSLFYIALPGNSAAPNDGAVAVVDPKSLSVVENFAVTGCSPNGAALGPNDELLLGCSAGPEQVIDIRSGSLVASITGTTGGCDEVAYNAGTNHFAGACTDSNTGSTDNLDLSDANPPITFDQAINTGARGAHSVAADPNTMTEWMPVFGGVCGTTPTTQACIAIFGGGRADSDELALP